MANIGGSQGYHLTPTVPGSAVYNTRDVCSDAHGRTVAAANAPQVDVETDNFMRSLVTLWTQCKKCRALQSMLQTRFSQVGQPFEKALVMVRQCPDYNPSKQTSLAFTVMEEFGEWVKYVGPTVYDSLTVKLKHEAFQVASRQRNWNLSLLIVDVYRLVEDNNHFLPYLRKMLQLHMYKEVCEWSIPLNLQDKFGINEFLVPLLLLDKLNVVESFLKKSPAHNLQLVQFLDDLIGQENMGGYMASLASELDVPDIKPAVFSKFSQYKTLIKMVKKLRAIHNISEDKTPNCSTRHAISSVNFLVYRRYSENVIGREGFREMVLDSIKNNSHKVIQHLILKLCDAGDPKEANYWIDYFSVPFEELPSYVQETLSSVSEPEEIEPTEEFVPPVIDGWSNAHTLQPRTDDPTYYLQLPIPLSQVIMVDTESSFEALIESAVDGHTVLGLDCEWKPTMVGKSVSNLSLIQISTPDCVYLLDVMRLEKYDHLWAEFVLICLANPQVMKVGFGLSTDLNMMSSRLPHGGTPLESRAGFLDLMTLWNRLTKDYNIALPYKELAEESGSQGLSGLVLMCLGQRLNKTEQFSNWECRPLRESQIIYAALDAYCLLDVYSTIRNVCEQSEIPIDDLICELMTSGWPKKSKKSKNTKQSSLEQPMGRPYSGGNGQPVSVHSLRTMCGSGMSRLAKKLRKCGIDTQLLPSPMSNDDLVDAANNLEEGRILILKSSVYSQIKTHRFSPTNVYIVEAKNPGNQFKEVLDYFNILVTKEDLLSRCQQCNSLDLFTASPELVSQNLPMPAFNGMPPELLEEDNYDNDDYGYDYSLDDYQDDYYEPAPSPQPKKWLTYKNKEIEVKKIPDHILSTASEFIICNDCGDICWEEGYFDNVLGSHGGSH